jgi:hypothetical protein
MHLVSPSPCQHDQKVALTPRGSSRREMGSATNCDQDQEDKAAWVRGELLLPVERSIKVSQMRRPIPISVSVTRGPHQRPGVVNSDVVTLRKIELSLVAWGREVQGLHHLARFGPMDVLLGVVAYIILAAYKLWVIDACDCSLATRPGPSALTQIQNAPAARSNPTATACHP